MRDDVFKISVENMVGGILFGYFVHPVIDFLHKYEFIPNHLTTFSFIFQLWGVFYLSQNYIYLFSFNYFLGYYFDCLDGPMARKFDMVTKFGDWYDHVTDLTCYILTNYILIMKYNFLKYPSLVIIDLIMLTGLTLYAGCQERIYNKGLKNQEKISGTLYITTYFISDEEKTIKKLRLFCYTNYVIYMCSLPILLSYLESM